MKSAQQTGRQSLPNASHGPKDRPGTYYIRFACRDDDSWVQNIIAVDEDEQKYKLKIESEKEINVTCESNETLDISIVSENGNTSWSGYVSEESRTFEDISLEEGNYTVFVETRNDFGASYKIKTF